VLTAGKPDRYTTLLYQHGVCTVLIAGRIPHTVAVKTVSPQLKCAHTLAGEIRLVNAYHGLHGTVVCYQQGC